MGKKASPLALAGTGTGNLSPRGDGDGEASPDGEFPVAIFTPEAPVCRGILSQDSNVKRGRGRPKLT